MSGLMSGIWKRSNSCCHRARSRLYYAIDAGRLPLTTGLHGSPQDRSYQATCVTTQFQRLRNRALTITRCSSRSCARELISCGGRGELLVTEFVGFEGFIVNSSKEGMRPSHLGSVAVLPTSLMACVYILQTGSSTWRIVGVEDSARIGRRAQEESEGGSS